MIVADRPAAAAPSTAAAPAHAYRPDIDGLRAVSIMLVVLFHAGIAGFDGGFIGVDVFFVISGMLITGLLLKDADAGQLRLREFYARRARRLLPLSSLVIAATVIGAWQLLPPLDRTTLLEDARAATLYIANWRFALESGDYFGSAVDQSYLVHFWSLAIEEQFYIVWPLLILVGTAITRPCYRWVRTATLTTLIGAPVIASLVASITMTDRLGGAYYLTQLRFWELGAGALLALAAHRIHLPKRVAGVLALVGLGGIVAAVVVIDASTVFPGVAALLPVGGTVLFLAATATPGTFAGRLLSTPPLPAIGRVSYAWYLWHWPVILGIRAVRHRGGIDFESYWDMPAAIVVSLILAIGSHHLVEDPVRFSRRLGARSYRGLALGGALMASLIAITMTLPIDQGLPPTKVGSRTPGALIVTPEEARSDFDAADTLRCRAAPTSSKVRDDCVFGDPLGTRTIALIGDSHAGHWFRAFEAIAVHHRWRLLFWTKGACAVTDVPVGTSLGEDETCPAWRDALFARLAQEPRLDLVVYARAHGYRASTLDADGEQLTPETVGPTWEEGTRRMLDRLGAMTDRIIIMADTPVAPTDPPACVSAHLSDPETCAFPLAPAIHPDAALLEAEQRARTSETSFVDMTDVVCPADPCSVVSPDGLIVFRDAHHITGRFARSIAFRLEPRIVEVLSLRPSDPPIG